MMRKLLFFLLYAAPVLAQGTPYENYVVAANGPNGSLTPITFANITVCAGVHTEIPCTPAVTLYSDLALTQVISPPLTSGPLGNYRFVVSPGTYSVSFTGPGISSANDVIVIPNTANNQLWVGPGATPTIATQEAAAIAAGGGVVNISPGYTGAESANCSTNGADGFNTWSGNPLVTIVDLRVKGTCQYSVAYNPSNAAGYGFTPFAATKFFTSPSSTASAAIFTSKYAGNLSTIGNLNGITAEEDIIGAVTANPSASMNDIIAEFHPRSTGGTISDAAVISAGWSIDRTSTSTNVTRAYGLNVQPMANLSTSGATVANAWGIFAGHQTIGTVTNYSIISAGRTLFTFVSNDNGIDFQTAGGADVNVVSNDGTDLLLFKPLSTAKGFGFNAELVAGGSQNVSGCSLTNALGGAWAGSFKSGTSGTCTVTITPGITAPNGFACDAHDLTTAADANNMVQTAYNQTTATIAGTTVSADLITWKCVAF